MEQKKQSDEADSNLHRLGLISHDCNFCSYTCVCDDWLGSLGT